MEAKVVRPTREEFNRPFCEWVSEFFAQHEDAPLVKVVPPKGYQPRQSAFPSLSTVKINTPIQQRVGSQLLGVVDTSVDAPY